PAPVTPAPPAEPRAPAPERGGRAVRRQARSRWQPEFVASWGLSPTFRVFLFLGGIVAVLVFLLYNEYVIREFKRQERDRVKLYAQLYGLAVSPEVPDGVAGPIFQEIISNRQIQFPVVVTDHRGDILIWNGPGMPPQGDRSHATLARVREIMEQMDAANEPVQSFEQNQAAGRILRLGQSIIITDGRGDPVVWDGPGLPSPTDTTVAAWSAVQAVAAVAGDEGVPLEVPAQWPSTLLFDGRRYAVVDNQGQPLAWGGSGMPAPGDTAAAAAALKELKLGNGPLSFRIPTEKYIHYGHSDLIGRISVAPVVSIGAVVLFALVGYMGFRNLRRSEQRSIWVGMAKETAHQLGTPLSSLAGWLELMASRTAATGGGAPAAVPVGPAPPESAEAIAREMQKDLSRLNQIASRFSQIGSVPELRPGDVGEVITETIAYFRSRGPQFGRHALETELEALPQVPLNAELLSWALENLVKNAMDAVGQQEGIIRVRAGLHADRPAVRITVEDNGRGIEPENLARVFEPGFSTKKRGWGLGLAFVKRIVEEYHGGRIQIIRSGVGQGTVFEICLPTA
ncbi:MAG: HAMP domain-containing sensor histidine kinase, partial [Gemmatimonadota bacterium]